MISATRAELRRSMDVNGDTEAATIWTMIRADRVTEDGLTVFQCAALTPTGCALERAARPWMCNAFPYAGNRPCHCCGATSDAEARGVALMRIGEGH